MQFEKNLVLLRKRKGWSQEELAFAVGVSRQTIYSWEAGINYPSILTLKKVADALGVTTDDLLNGFGVNRLPETIKDLKLTYVSKYDGEVLYEELPNWFIKLKADEEVCWALYDIRKNSLIMDYAYQIYTRGEAIIHNLDCIEIEVKVFDEKLNHDKTYNQFISLTNEGVAWAAESAIVDGKRIIKTFKDKDFMKDWGIGIGGAFVYQKTKYTEAENYILEYNGVKQNVIKIAYFDPDGSKDPKRAYFEVFLNKDFESLVWRRFTKVTLKDKYSGVSIEVDGEKYDSDYYAITSRLL